MINSGAVAITGYTGTNGTIEIPSFVDGYPVTGIANNAISGNQNVVSILISSNVFYIGDGAFDGCGNLTNITVDPNSGYYSSFNGCLFDKNYTTLIQYPAGLGGSYAIPFGVTSVKDYAFDQCNKLTNVTISSSVTNIGYNAFVSAYGLSSIMVDASNPVFSSTNGVLFDKTQTLLIRYPHALYGGYSIPNTVGAIGDSAFDGCVLTNIVFSGSVTNIGSYAFAYCSSLGAVTMPMSVNSVGVAAFLECSALTNVVISDRVGSIGDYAFASCSSLSCVTIPAGVTNIADYAFSGCSNLTAVNFLGNAPGAWTGTTVFQYDTNAIAYYLPETTGWAAMYDGIPAVLQWPNLVVNGGFETGDLTGWLQTGNLGSINLGTATNYAHSGQYGARVGPYGTLGSLSQNIVTERGNTYQISIWLNSLGRLPNEFAIIWGGNVLFDQTNIGVTGWTNLQFTALATGSNEVLKMDFRNDPSYFGLDDITVKQLPNNWADFAYVTNDAAIAITGYTGTNARVVIPGFIHGFPVTSVADYAFYSDYIMEDVTLPEAVTDIGYAAFYSCGNLTNLVIPDCVLNIGEDAFCECYNLTAVAIPMSVTYIGVNAFALCSHLTNICVDSKNQFYSSLDGALADKSRATLLQFPGGVGGSYIIPGTVLNIGYRAFYGCVLNQVAIPGTVKSIGDGAFGACWGLSNVVIASGVCSIGSSAFQDCTALSNVIIPGSVTNVGAYAFANGNWFAKFFFQGDSPGQGNDLTVFNNDSYGMVFFMPGTAGWGTLFDGLPAAPYLYSTPSIMNNGHGSVGVNSQFHLTVSWASNTIVVVEACTNLGNPVWVPVSLTPSF